MNRESIIITINRYEDLEKIDDNIKYINLNIKNIDKKIIEFLKENGKNYYYSDSINNKDGYIYVDYNTFIIGNNVIDKIISNIPSNLSKLEISKYLYISIGKLISYDINIIPDKNEIINYSNLNTINNIWGALSNLKATNQSYCKLYLYLCSLFNIDCEIITINNMGVLANKLTIDNNTLIVELTADIPFIQAGYKTKYFSDYNDDIEIDRKINYILDNYNEIKLEKILKNNDNNMLNILSNIQTILNISNMEPISLEVILSMIFSKYYSNMNIKINNFYINDKKDRKHFIVITHKDNYYSYNYNKNTFIEINEKDLHYNIEHEKIGIYLKENLHLLQV